MESDFARNCLDAIEVHLRSIRTMLEDLPEIKAALIRKECSETGGHDFQGRYNEGGKCIKCGMMFKDYNCGQTP